MASPSFALTCMSDRRTRWLTLLAGLLLAMLGAAVARAGEPEPSRQPAKDGGPDWFEDLGDAAARGAIEPALAKRLEGGEPVIAFAALDGREVLAAYGDGSRRGAAAAAAVLARMREDVQREVPVEVVRSYRIVPVLLVRIEDAGQALELVNLRIVRSIAPDYENEHALAQSLPLIRRPLVAPPGLGGSGAAVAVLDTGVDYTRSAFGPCSAPGTPQTPGGTCRVTTTLDTAPDDGSLDADPNRHGTNVAGIVAGVAPDAKLIGIDAFDGPIAHDSYILAGLDWVLQNRAIHRIRAVNMSLYLPARRFTGLCGGGFFDRNPYVLTFTLLRSAGIVPVVAAGNDAFQDGQFQDGIAHPACAGAFSVGAVYDSGPNTMTWGRPSDPRFNCTDTNVPADAVTCFSQDGPQLGVLAPGANITAAGITLGGTSQAAPHVAGAAAILAAARPFSTAEELERLLRTSATTVTDPRSNRSHPRLDLTAAVRAAFPVPNDDRAAATPLNAWGGRYEQTTWTATKESGEPMHAGRAGGASVWFRWTAARAGSATFTTQGSDYDTLLAVYRTAANGALVPVAANDDAVAGSTTSTVQLPVSAGDVLLIAVDGRDYSATDAATGHLRLTTNLPHDDIAQAGAIWPGTPATSANIGATREPGEPAHCHDTFASRSVWYRWTPSAAGAATVRAAGATTLCVAVYDTPAGAAAGFGLLSPVAYASDDQGQPAEVAFAATPSRSYWIAVDGVSHETACNPVTGQCFYGTTAGSFTLSLTAP